MADEPPRNHEPGSTDADQMDDILSTINVFSLKQLLVYGTVFCMLFVTMYYHGIVFFTGFSPPWRCCENATSNFCRSNHNNTFSLDSNMFNERCNLNRDEWTYVTNKQYSFVTEYDLVCEKRATAAFIGAAFYIGCVFGAFLGGPIADAYGRKTTIVVFLMALLSPGILLRFTNELWHLYPLQFTGGLGLSGILYPAFVYVAEMSPPQHRATALSLANFFSSLGYMMMDLTAYCLQSWRHLYMYLSIPMAPFVLAFLLLPESPRWLLTKRRHSEVEKVLLWLTNKNISIQMQVSNTMAPESSMKHYTYLDLIRNGKVFLFTLRIAILWSVIPVVYYTIAVQSLNYGGSMYINYLLASLSDFPAYFLTAFLINRIGRKKTNLAGCFGSSLLIIMIPIMPRHFVHRHMVLLVLTIVARLSCCTAFLGVYIWTPELFPTVVRAQGMAVCGIFEKVAMISIPFVCTLLNNISYSLPFILMSVLGVLGCLAVFRTPETLNQPTRETYEDFFQDRDVVDRELGINNPASE